MTTRPTPARALRRHPARGELVIDSSDAGHVIATFNPLLVAVFTRVPKDDELELIQKRANDAVESGVVGGMLYVVARREMTGGVDPRVRAVFESMVRKNQSRTGSNAVVVLTGGFAAAVVRGALAGLLALVERRNKLRVFATVDDAATWLAKEHALDAAALRDAYAKATAHLDLP